MSKPDTIRLFSLADAWDHFMYFCGPLRPGVSDPLRIAFYSGAAAFYSVAIAASRMNRCDFDALAAKVEQELLDFDVEMKARRAAEDAAREAGFL